MEEIGKSMLSFPNIVTTLIYTKTGLVFGFSRNQSLVAVILGQNSFWILSENYFEMSILIRGALENDDVPDLLQA
jgi:hypothetical protein